MQPVAVLMGRNTDMHAYCDGACKVSNPGQTSCAYAIYDGDAVFQASSRYLGPELYTNNYAEFQGLLDLLKWSAQNSITKLDINCDSQLVVRLVSGEWKVKHEELRPFRDLAQALMIRGGHMLHWVRGHSGNTGNELVDFLCNDELRKQGINVRQHS
jgi:ribonuclease HI